MLAGSSRLSKTFGLIGTAAGVGSLLYFAYQQWASQPQTSFGQAKAAHKEQFAKAKELVARDANSPVLRDDTVQAIQDFAAQVCKADYKALVVKCRAERRSVDASDRASYEAVVITHAEEISQLLFNAIRLMCSEIGIEYSRYEASVDLLVEEKKFEEVSTSMVASLKKSMFDPTQYKHLTAKEVLEVYLFALEEYDLYKPQQTDYKMVIRDAILEDAIFAKYQLEEEELETIADKKSNDHEIATARATLKTLRQNACTSAELGASSILLWKIAQKPILMKPS